MIAVFPGEENDEGSSGYGWGLNHYYCHVRGIQAVASRQGDVIVRYLATNLPKFDRGRNKESLAGI